MFAVGCLVFLCFCSNAQDNIRTYLVHLRDFYSILVVKRLLGGSMQNLLKDFSSHYMNDNAKCAKPHGCRTFGAIIQILASEVHW